MVSPIPAGLYLGCYHQPYDTKKGELGPDTRIALLREDGKYGETGIWITGRRKNIPANMFNGTFFKNKNALNLF